MSVFFLYLSCFSTRFIGVGVTDYQSNREGNFTTGKGHWIVFNEDLFGFLWITTREFSLFHRAQEPKL